MIIEFLGLPGVGKSTIYKKVVRNNNNFLIIVNYIIKNKTISFKTKLLFVLLKYMPLRSGRKLKLCTILIKKKKIVSSDEELLSLVLYNIFNSRKKSVYKYDNLYNFNIFHNYYNLLTKINSSKPAVLDEGMLQKVFFFLDHENFEFRQIDITNFLKKIRLPSVVIYCHLEENLLIKRIITRHKTVDSHKNTNQLKQTVREQERALSFVVSWLKSNNIKIIELDMSNPISHNSAIVKKVIKKH